MEMSRTIWFALFCVVGLGAAMAIRTAGPFATPVAATADESNIELAGRAQRIDKIRQTAAAQRPCGDGSCRDRSKRAASAGDDACGNSTG